MTVLGVDAGVAAVLVATLVVAAGVQGLVGLGLALVSAPVIAIVAPELLPQLLLWLALLLPFVTLVREHHEIDWRGLAWSLPSRIPGTLLGVLLVAWFPPQGLAIAVAVMVLLSVLLTVRAVEIPVTPATLSAAGFVSGVTGTATSIGGPPIAILYQHRSPRQIRSTLALFFVVGAALSLTGLGFAGMLEVSTLLLALALVPALVVGFAGSRFLDRRIHRGHVRAGVLVVSGLSAVVALLRALFSL